MRFTLNHEISISKLFDGLSMPKPPGDLTIKGICPLNSVDEGYLTFSKTTDIDAKSGVIFVTSCDEENPTDAGPLYIKSSQPRKDFIRCLDWLDKNIGFKTDNKPAQIPSSVIIGKNVSIKDNVIIGENVIIESNVTIHRHSIIGDHSRIRAGACIGGDGFGFERDEHGKPIRFVHFGGVDIGEYVEIGSNACICRGTFSNTRISDNAKIDNLVHIAHNVSIGEGSYIIAGASVAGSCTIGARVWIGPNASIINGSKIGDDAIIGMGAVIISDVEQDVTMAAVPARKFPQKDKL